VGEWIGNNSVWSLGSQTKHGGRSEARSGDYPNCYQKQEIVYVHISKLAQETRKIRTKKKNGGGKEREPGWGGSGKR